MLLLLSPVRYRFGTLPLSFHTLFVLSTAFAAAVAVASVQDLVYAYMCLELSMA